MVYIHSLYSLTYLIPFKFETPFTHICSVATQSGRSTFWKRILQELLIEPFPNEINQHFPASTIRALHREVLKTVPNFQLRICSPDFQNESSVKECQGKLLILDDLLFNISSEDMQPAQFFAFHCHHSSCSIVVLSLCYPKHFSSITNNSAWRHYILVTQFCLKVIDSPLKKRLEPVY